LFAMASLPLRPDTVKPMDRSNGWLAGFPDRHGLIPLADCCSGPDTGRGTATGSGGAPYRPRAPNAIPAVRLFLAVPTNMPTGAPLPSAEGVRRRVTSPGIRAPSAVLGPAGPRQA